MKISKRIQFLAEQSKGYSTYADIGCDHGYYAISLLKENPNCIVYCSDVNPLPLQSAKENVLTLFPEAKAHFILSDGLSGITEDVDVICIAGMGGNLIKTILNDGLKKAQQAKKIVLQANTNLPTLREFLMGEHFNIIEEVMLKEDHKYYTIMVCIYDGITKTYLEDDLFFGPKLRKDKSKLYLEFWSRTLVHYESKITQIKQEKERQKIIKIIELIKRNV